MNARKTGYKRVASVARYMAVAALTIGAVAAFMSTTEAAPPAPPPQNGALRYISNNAFGLGEVLTFDVNYKFITAGTAVMAVADKPTTVSGRPTYDVRFEVRTTSSFDKVFKVRDRYKTYIDMDGIFPWRFEQTVREGKYSRDFSANIDQKANIARTTEGSFKTPPYVHDILSAFYYIRALDLKGLKKGQSLSLKNFYGKEAHDLRVRVLGRERVEVDAGTFDCIVVEPMVVEGGLFKNEGRIVVYLTDDDRKIPVKVSTKVLIGSIDGELTKYSGVRGPVASKKN